MHSASTNKPNRLIQENSLYLKQHAFNPVDWFPWNHEALQKAIKEQKPILVSIGYSSCHWCHVMERESFESQEVAEFLNQHFVSIKVDREERPDLDHIYMEALQTISGQGGWPLNMFLTPDLKPFYGGTYFPPRPLYGRPSFIQILHKIHELFTERRGELNVKANQLAQAIGNDLLQHVQPESMQNLNIESIIQHFESSFESEFGGFSSAPKFPQPMILDALLRLSIQENRKDLMAMITKTLDELGKGGIYDQIGGGFHRYSTDREWLVPHFEKMLYDNAQLLHTYSMAFLASQKPFYKHIAHGIFNCLERDFRNADGGFGSAWDADSEGEEGAFYVWNNRVLNEVLQKDELDFLKRWTDISEYGNWEGQIILRLTEIPDEESWEYLQSFFKKLHASRTRRVHPSKDPKKILAWNSMVIQAYYTWYFVSGNVAVKQLLINDINRLLKEKKEVGRWERVPGVPAFGDDLAHLGIALLRAFQLSGNDEYLSEAEDVSDILRTSFFDASTSSFQLAPLNQDLIHSPKELFDNAVPSTQAVATRFFIEYGHISGDMNMSMLGEAALQRMFSLIQRYPSSCACSLQTAIQLRKPFSECVLVGDNTATFFSHLPNYVFWDAFLFDVPAYHDSNAISLQGKRSENGETLAFWCEGFQCKQPVSDVESLNNLIQQGRQ
jgi:uncharacterized protein YyaL (SSP411 family)